MFFLSRHTGRLADRYGPRVFMGGGPLVAAAGLLLLQRVDANPDYVTDVLPGLLVFSLGLSLTVAPLTATVLADADEHNAGIASGVNNAIARVASLLGVAAIGAIVAAQFTTSLDDARRRARAQPAAARRRCARPRRRRSRRSSRAGSRRPSSRRSRRRRRTRRWRRSTSASGSRPSSSRRGGVLGLVGHRQPAALRLRAPSARAASSRAPRARRRAPWRPRRSRRRPHGPAAARGP